MTFELASRFVHPVLTVFPDARPTAHDLNILHEELRANAMAIPTLRGDPSLGHLALVVTAADYIETAIGNVAFIPPPNPGPLPEPQVPNNPQTRAEAKDTFIQETKAIEIYTKTEAYLKNQILAAVPATFIEILKQPKTGHARVMALMILLHLDENYGEVIEFDLSRNYEEMNKTWTTDMPLEKLFAQVHLCRQFAKEHDPITELTGLRAITKQLADTGAYALALEAWHLKAKPEKTLAAAHAYFTVIDKARLRNVTSKDAGYHAANNTTFLPPNQKRKTGEAMPPTAPITGTTTGPNEVMYYCWSHGLGKSPNHTSQSCRVPAAGHVRTATAGNLQGGCTQINKQRGEKTIYQRPERRNTAANVRASPAQPRAPHTTLHEHYIPPSDE